MCNISAGQARWASPMNLRSLDRGIFMNNEEKILLMLEGQGTILEKHSSLLEGLTNDVTGLKQGQVQTNQRLDVLTNDVNELKSDVVGLKQSQSETNQRLDWMTSDLNTLTSEVTDLKQGQFETNQKLNALNNNVRAVMQHQNEDYILLKNVDKKVDDLAAISDIHEQRLNKLRAI